MSISLFYVAYLPRTAIDRLDWLSNFSETLPNYQTRFNITEAEVGGVLDAYAALENARITLQNYTANFKKAVTAYANELDTDPTPNMVSQPIFNPSTVSPPLMSGIFARIDALVQSKILPTANDTEKTALGLNPIEVTSSATPTITDIEAMARGQVALTMNRGGSKLTYVTSRRAGESAFAMLFTVADTHYLDTRPNLVAGTSEVREYQIEWSTDGRSGTGVLSPIASIATLA